MEAKTVKAKTEWTVP